MALWIPFLLLPSLLGQLSNAQLNLFINGTQSTENLSQDCTSALNRTIACDAYLLQLASTDYYGSLNNASLQSAVCATACSSSLSSYHNNVATACANDSEPWQGVPAVWAGDVLWATYNTTCLKDPGTGQFCNDVISNFTDFAGDVDQPITSISQAQLCSPCMIALLQHLQSTPYSNYDDQYVQQWTAVQSTCNTGPLPTAVQPPVTNITSLPGVSGSNPVDTSLCLSGNHYTVQPGDGVQIIATAQGVSTGMLKSLNGIFPDGTNLFAGQVLCLPRQCPVYTVQPNDTCATVAAASGLSIVQLLSYNPSINSACSNIISNTNICLGPSGAQYTPTTIPGATSTTSAYATATVAPPGSVAFGSTPDCGKYYQINPGDICQQISLNNSITVDLFEAINPSINIDCTNLTPGLFYCVWPTADWNSTASTTTTSTPISAPGPTPSGTISTCFQWHTVVSGDTCSLIQSSAGISFEQLQGWNPQLNSQCTNLLLGDAYCVDAPSTATTTGSSSTVSSTTSTSSSTSTSTSSATAPGPTQAGIASNCDAYVLQQDGVFCFDMAAAAGITLDQLYQWNPALNGDCSGLWVGYAYCIGVSSSQVARRGHREFHFDARPTRHVSHAV